MRKLVFTAVALLLAGCASRDIQNSDAVKQGVVDYLTARTAETGLDINTMLVDVGSVSFQKDEAHATVMFRPKSAPEAGGMQMSYTLDRKGNKWVVRGKGEMSVGHGGPEGLPPGHPTSAAPGSEGQALPPGHPITAPGATGALPKGHPPIGSKQ